MVGRTGIVFGVAVLSGFFFHSSCVRDRIDPETKAETDPSVESVAASFLHHYSTANARELGDFFAVKVAIHGDKGFLGTESRLPRDEVVEVGNQELVEAYSTFFATVGVDRWTEMASKLKPTLVEAENADEPIPGVEVGDFVYDLHFREATKGKARGMDEAVIFVFRRVGAAYEIVAHYSDY